VIPKIDIWRVANLVLNRYGDQAEAESTIRSAELAEAGDSAGAAVWRWVTDAIGQLRVRSLGPISAEARLSPAERHDGTL
jgi:hypothetical protein